MNTRIHMQMCRDINADKCDPLMIIFTIPTHYIWSAMHPAGGITVGYWSLLNIEVVHGKG